MDLKSGMTEMYALKGLQTGMIVKKYLQGIALLCAVLGEFKEGGGGCSK